jgi:hypothetical protein
MTPITSGAAVVGARLPTLKALAITPTQPV